MWPSLSSYITTFDAAHSLHPTLSFTVHRNVFCCQWYLEGDHVDFGGLVVEEGVGVFVPGEGFDVEVEIVFVFGYVHIQSK